MLQSSLSASGASISCIKASGPKTGARVYSTITAASTPGKEMALPKLNLNVANFRDLCEANSMIKPGRIWRCARPSSASEADVCILLDQLGIRDLIDLRSTEELSEDPYYDPYQPASSHTPNPLTGPNLTSTNASVNGIPMSVSPGSSSTHQGDNNNSNASSDPSTNDTNEDEQRTPRKVRTLLQGTQFRRYMRRWLSWQPYIESKGPSAPVVHHQVSLLERNRYYRALLAHVPPVNLAKAVLLGLLQFKEESRLILLKEVNAGGLGLLYKILIDSAQIEIRTCLELILQSLQCRRPVLFFCKAGKDRTGIIAALVLACSGASDLQIVEDYARSDAFHAVALAGIENKPELAGLDRKAFERAPAEAMRETIKYVDRQYGSLSAYMTRIGFDADKQRHLRVLLIRED